MQAHVIDTQTFEAKYVRGFPTNEFYADDEKGWMWMTGSTAEDCDDLFIINTDDPSKVYFPCHYPFLNRMTGKNNQSTTEVEGSLVTFAGDRMWITGSSIHSLGQAENNDLEAYSADMDKLFKETKPLVVVPWADDITEMKMLFAGNFLWVLTTHGDKRGYLYQLDPQTGATLISLDVTGNQSHNGFNDVEDMATDGEYLWIREMGFLVQIKLP